MALTSSKSNGSVARRCLAIMVVIAPFVVVSTFPQSLPVTTLTATTFTATTATAAAATAATHHSKSNQRQQRQQPHRSTRRSVYVQQRPPFWERKNFWDASGQQNKRRQSTLNQNEKQGLLQWGPMANIAPVVAAASTSTSTTTMAMGHHTLPPPRPQRYTSPARRMAVTMAAAMPAFVDDNAKNPSSSSLPLLLGLFGNRQSRRKLQTRTAPHMVLPESADVDDGNLVPAEAALPLSSNAQHDVPNADETGFSLAVDNGDEDDFATAENVDDVNDDNIPYMSPRLLRIVERQEAREQRAALLADDSREVDYGTDDAIVHSYLSLSSNAKATTAATASPSSAIQSPFRTRTVTVERSNLFVEDDNDLDDGIDTDDDIDIDDDADMSIDDDFFIARSRDYEPTPPRQPPPPSLMEPFDENDNQSSETGRTIEMDMEQDPIVWISATIERGVPAKQIQGAALLGLFGALALDGSEGSSTTAAALVVVLPILTAYLSITQGVVGTFMRLVGTCVYEASLFVPIVCRDVFFSLSSDPTSPVSKLFSEKSLETSLAIVAGTFRKAQQALDSSIDYWTNVQELQLQQQRAARLELQARTLLAARLAMESRERQARSRSYAVAAAAVEAATETTDSTIAVAVNVPVPSASTIPLSTVTPASVIAAVAAMETSDAKDSDNTSTADSSFSSDATLPAADTASSSLASAHAIAATESTDEVAMAKTSATPYKAVLEAARPIQQQPPSMVQLPPPNETIVQQQESQSNGSLFHIGEGNSSDTTLPTERRAGADSENVASRIQQIEVRTKEREQRLQYQNQIRQQMAAMRQTQQEAVSTGAASTNLTRESKSPLDWTQLSRRAVEVRQFVERSLHEAGTTYSDVQCISLCLIAAAAPLFEQMEQNQSPHTSTSQ